jgi:transglutaminase-like putative cysteine protease
MIERIDRHAFELVAAVVVIAIVAHAGHLPTWLLPTAPAIVALRVFMRRRGAPIVPMSIRIIAAALLVALIVVEYGTLFGREPGSVLGCGLLALKVLETEKVRDARVAVGFGAFVLMSALLFVQTLVFTLAVSLALVLFLAALVALQPAPATTTHRLRGELRAGATLLALGLPLAAAAFALVPRLASPLWGTQDRGTEAHTGLDDSMEPGRLTELLIDDSPAFRAYFSGAAPPPQQRYFRSIVLTDFDGATWKRSERRDLHRPADAESIGTPIDYAITLLPTERRWLPALDLPLSAPVGARLSADRELTSYDPVTQPREYRVRSASRYTLAPTLGASERARALMLPDGFDARTRALAEGWRADGADDRKIIDDALALFHAQFTYTLNPPLLGRNSVDDFLFATKKGFCEHYASAFVVLMRAAGIPARVVTGFQGGWWNADGGYLLVRNSDAHAWAEAWLDGRGWVRVDPTASVSPARIELGASAANDSASWSQAAWLREVRNRFDRVNGWWTEAVIRFDALRQKGMLTPFGVNDANPGDLLLVLSGVLAGVLLVATLWAMRERAMPSGDALDRAWSRLVGRLARDGVAPKPSEGPLDWLARARAARPVHANMLGALVDDYVSLRYGETEPRAERIRAFTWAVRNFCARRTIEARATLLSSEAS